MNTNWRDQWFEFNDAAYFDVSAQGPMPKVAHRAAQAALDWKKLPQNMPETAYFELPNKIRASVAKLIGAKPDEIAVTTGASGGLLALANSIEWRPGDEVMVARGDFPAQFTTWKPLEARGRLTVKVVAPRERFLSADDFIAAIGPKTRLVSAALVRHDDGSLLDAARVAAACHAHGALLLLDASQCVGAMPMDVTALGADFIVAAAYKWLLGPYGTGFFWVRGELIDSIPVGPFFWMALEGAHKFHAFSVDHVRVAPGARRWDAPETASFINLFALDASLEFVLQMGPETVLAHNRRLIECLYDRMPRDRCVVASPREPERRGPFACFAARTPEKSAALHERLRKANVFTSLREGCLRIAPHLYNSEHDIDRIIAEATV
jgi:cysteine desulfurase / selenocysteine lyase